MFGCNNDRLFSEKFTVKDYISNTKLEQGDHYYIQTQYKDLFCHYNLILRKLYEKCPEKRPKIQTIGKKVYSGILTLVVTKHSS